MSKKAFYRKIDPKLITKFLYVGILLIDILLIDAADGAFLIFPIGFLFFFLPGLYLNYYVGTDDEKHGIFWSLFIDLVFILPGFFIMELSLLADVITTPIFSDLSIGIILYLLCIVIIFLTAYLLPRVIKTKYKTKKRQRLWNIVLLLYFIGFLLSGLLHHVIHFLY